MRPHAIATIALASALARGASAEEPPRTFSLSWVRLAGAESCVSTQGLAEIVERRLDRRVFVSAAQADLSVEGHIERAGSAWSASITIADRSGNTLGTRDIQSQAPGCEEASEKAALAVALMIDPDGAAEDPPPTSPNNSAPRVVLREVVIPVPIEHVVPAEPAPPPPPLRARAQVSVIAGAGALPGASLGFEARAALRPPSFWGLQITGILWLPRDATIAPTPNQGAHLFLAHGGVSLCPLWTSGERLRVIACAGVEAGALSAQSFGFERDQDVLKLVLNAALDANVSLRLAGPVAIAAGLRLAVPLERYRLFVRGPDDAEVEVFRPFPVAASLNLGVALELP